MLRYAQLALLALAACAPAPSAQVTKARPAAEPAFVPVQAAAAQVTLRSNAELARDFLDLSFAMESGRGLSVLSRFEGPVTIGLSGDIPSTAPDDLAALVGRLRGEAGLPVALAPKGEAASITVEFSARSALRRFAPSAACFVVPNVSSLAEYRSKRGTAAVDWAKVTTRTRVAIFVPNDTSPQEIRDCLHEEVAQALGPLNDLYRLPDSVFNDDNFHTVLTRFDMLMLRAYYSPALKSGMGRDEATKLVPGIIAALNPGDPGISTGKADPTPKGWTVAIEAALGRSGGIAARKTAADRALAIAIAEGWGDNRLAFSHFAVGRLNAGTDRPRALASFAAAAEIYARQSGGDVHVAHIGMQLAAIALASGRAADAVRFADEAIPAVKRHENAALLATLMLIKAEALDRLGDATGAAALRLDSRPWARYGFGSDAVVEARMRDITLVADRGIRG